jgi:hypothetical protein
MHEFVSEYSILFHWSSCLFLCLYHAVFITMALYLKSGIVIPPVLLFLLSIALAIQGLLRFHMNLRTEFLKS